MKQIRLSNDNEAALNRIIADSKNDLLTLPKAANIAIQLAIPKLKSKFTKRAKS